MKTNNTWFWITFFIIICCFMVITSPIGGVNEAVKTSNYQKQYNGNNIDSMYTVRHVCNTSGHEYYLYEYGVKGQAGYAFSVEHSMECKKCYGIFD